MKAERGRDPRDEMGMGLVQILDGAKQRFDIPWRVAQKNIHAGEQGVEI